MLDSGTRPTHRQLDGKIVELEEYFILGDKKDGKKARFPGDFGKPEEDCNCRCVALTRAKWALDEAELAQLKERAAYWKLDKKDDFEDFEKKYLKAAEPLKNQGKSGIIQRGNLTFPKQKLTEYALNPDRQADKARAFKLALGYDLSNVDELIENILSHVDESRFVERGDAGYGMLYQFVMRLTGVNGKEANVLTSWIREGERFRLTSVYVTDKKVTG